MGFFETMFGFVKITKNTKVEVILFESNIQYKEIAVKLVDTIINDQYIFYGNSELELVKKESKTNSGENQIPKINNNSIVSRERIFENNSKEDQVSEIIEILSDEEDKISEIIEISSNKENQAPKNERTPEIIVLLSMR
ncbi:18805_t:CDS:2 [Dentiscutata erythropus]|uniref:18805_t:CDS:1 n=1 Tax=Dentiscutata erythropus TaxID=1348616 RepID=A0A9N9IWQ7_9GLOM|nr:18805_t:CDS:2 [Dentiscutata erythropus]